MATSGKPGASVNAQTVYNALRAKGYSSAAAAGAVGNLQQESGVNPGSKQSGGAGRGIAQWGTGAGSGGRWEVENQYAASHKQDPWALNTQIGFLEQELSQRGFGPGSAFAKTTSVSGATSTFEYGIEQAGDIQMANRTSYASNAYAAFSGNPVNAASSSAPYSIVPGIHSAPGSPASKKAPAQGAKAGTQSPIGAALGTLGNLGGDAVSGAGTVAGDIGGALGNTAQAVTSPLQAVQKFTTAAFSVSFWIRVAFIIAGLALVFIGTKALLTGAPPVMPGTGPAPVKGAPAKKSFGKSIAEVAAA
jgi:hypothetical protein